MIDTLAVELLFTCLIVAMIGAAAFVASFHLRRRRRSTSTDAAASTRAVAAGDTSVTVGEKTPVVALAADTPGPKALIDSRSSAGESSEDADSCSHNCQLCGCGTCWPEEAAAAAEGQGDHRWEKQQQQQQSDSLQQILADSCGEFVVSSVDVGFKCRPSASSSQACSFFFYRGRQSVELLERVAPSERYLTMAALPAVPYHLWFCPAEHPAKSARCPDCRPVLSFELCDSQILFHHQQPAPADAENNSVVERIRGVWLLACKEEAGSTSIVYRGDSSSVSSLPYSGKLRLHFGLPPLHQAKQPLPPPPRLERTGAALKDNKAAASCDVACNMDRYSGQGDLLLSSDQYRKLRRHEHLLQKLCDRRGGHQRDDGEIDEAASSDSDETNSSAVSLRSDKIQSPISMGSTRKAVKWPITQIESLIESSSSDERPASALPSPDEIASVQVFGGAHDGGGGEVVTEQQLLDNDWSGGAR